MNPAPRRRSNPFLAVARIVAFVGMTFIFWICLALLRIGARTPEARVRLVGRWIHRWAWWGCRIFGLRVSVKGTPPTCGALVAPNHTGYCDILAISSVIPCFYVPKGEVGRWPAVGALLRFLEMPFISRRQNRELFGIIEQVETILERGGNVCVFLEGTSTGGDCVLQLRPALLQPAVKRSTPIVPAGLAYGADTPGIEVAEDVAYWKDHVFVPHLWRLAGLRGVYVDVRFGEPLTLGAADDRREAAGEIRNRILALLEL